MAAPLGPSIEPVTLVDITPLNGGGLLRLSDRNISFPAGPELVVNSGFEAGNFTGWSTGADANLTETVQGTVKHSGSYGAKLLISADGTYQGPRTSSAIVVDSNLLYTVSAALKTSVKAVGAGGYGLRIYIRYFEDEAATETHANGMSGALGTDDIGELTDVADWTPCTKTIGPGGSGADITFPAGTRSVIIDTEFIGDNTSEGYIDGISMNAMEAHYQAYIADVGGLGEELRRADSSALNTRASIKFHNERFRTYAYLVEFADAYPFEGAGVRVREAYLGADGQPKGNPVTLFSGVLDGPTDIDLMEFTCGLSTALHRADIKWSQHIIDKAAWPNAHEDLGAYEPIIYGAGVTVPALRVDFGAKSTLVGNMNASFTATPSSQGYTIIQTTLASNLAQFPAGSVGIAWQKVDEIPGAADDAATYVYPATDALSYLAVGPSGGGPHPPYDATIIGVRVTFRILTNTNDIADNYAEVHVQTGLGAHTLQGTRRAANTWTTFTEFFPVNPATGLTWIYFDPGQSNVWVYMNQTAGNSVKCTLLYWECLYTTGQLLPLTDASRFPAAGDIHIDDERITYGGISGNSLYDLTRGDGGTTATAHRKGAIVWEHKTNYDSLLADHELSEVSNIYAEVEGRLLRVTSGASAVVEGGKHLLRATEQINIQALEDDLTVTDDIDFITPGAIKNVIPNAAGGTIGNTASAWDGSENTWAGGSGGMPGIGTQASLTVGFPATDYGLINTQYIYITYLMNISGGGPAISCPACSSGNWSPTSMVVSASKVTVRYQRTGGSWDDDIQLTWTVVSGEWFAIYEVRKEVDYDANATKSGSALRGGSGLIGTHLVDRFHADVTGYEGAGYTHEVIKHFLCTRMGFGAGELDIASFDATHPSFAAGPYTPAFSIRDKVRPSEFLARLARESRATIKYMGGKWTLRYLPDSAPGAAREITAAELAGQNAKFLFRAAPTGSISNEVAARFARSYTRLGSESGWEGTASASDTASKSKFGAYRKDLDLLTVREQAHADAVVGHILKQLKEPLLRVEFGLFHEHMDLTVGDTIEIDNLLYDGKKFFIESITRRDRGMLVLSGVQWW